jgi:hypothetical protein
MLIIFAAGWHVLSRRRKGWKTFRLPRNQNDGGEDGDEATVQWLAKWAGCDGLGFSVLERVLGRSGPDGALSAHCHAQCERDESRR